MANYQATLGIVLFISFMATALFSGICLLKANGHVKPELTWRDLLAVSKATFYAHPERFFTPTGMKWLQRYKFSLAAAFAIAVLMMAASLAARFSR